MAFVLSALAFVLGPGRQEGPRIIDLHMHYSPRENFFEDLDRVYRPLRARACVNGFLRELPALVEGARRFPETVVPFGRISLDDPDVLDQVEAFRKAGFRGIKIHSPEKNYDDPSYFPVYARAEEHRMVLLLHTGISARRDPDVPSRRGSMARMRPMYLDTVARAFPKLALVGAHLGNPWYDEAAETARWNPNLFYDVTGSTLQKKAGNLALFKDYFWWKPDPSSPHMPKDAVNAFEKLVFGTDEDPLKLQENIDRYTKLLDACGVPPESRRKIFHETARRILRLD